MGKTSRDQRHRQSANGLAKAIGMPPNRITAILKDQRGITGGTAIRLGTFFQNANGILDEPANDPRPAHRLLADGTLVRMETVHFAEMTGALLAGCMAVRAET